jgi:hypothetical protein
MTGKADLQAPVTALEAAFDRSTQLAAEGFHESRGEIIQLRREISDGLAQLAKVGEGITDRALREEFRVEFSRMRSALALHLASWPVVLIKPDDPRYRTSIYAARAGYRAFFEWVRSA